MIGFGATTAYEASDGLVTLHIVADANGLEAIDPRISIVKNFGDGDLIVTVPRWGGFTEVMPKLAAAGARFAEISGNDEVVVTTVEPEQAERGPDKARFLFNSLVIAPEHKKRSVYVVRVENLGEALNSLSRNNIELEHVFDF